MPIRILIVDDNRDTLKTYARAILRNIKAREINQNSSEGYILQLPEIDEADTILVAKEKLISKSFDLLIVDLKIPGSWGQEWGGLELISESKRIDALRPIIVITGYGTTELARKTLIEGAFDFIEKSDKRN